MKLKEKYLSELKEEPNTKKKILLYSKCISIDPTDARLFFGRGFAYEWDGDLYKAEIDYMKANDLIENICDESLIELRMKIRKLELELLEWDLYILQFPNVANAYYKRALVKQRLKIFAKNDFDKYIDLKPHEYYGYYSRANYLFSLGEFDSAFKDYEMVQLLNPKSKNIIYDQLFTKLLIFGAKKESMIVAERDKFNVFNNQETHGIYDFIRNYKKGLVFYEQKLYEEAITEFNKMDGQNYLGTYIGLGNCHYHLNQFENALENYTKARILDKDWWLPKNRINKVNIALDNPNNPPELDPKSDKRIALVVGNSAYIATNDFSSLGDYPINDANDIAQTLRLVGFEQENIILKHNVDKATFDAIFTEFIKTAKSMQADVAVLYFAGHGVEIDKIHYWLPIDITMQNFEKKLISVTDLIEQLSKAGVKFKVGFSDSCRTNNPFYGKDGKLYTSPLERSVKLEQFMISQRGIPATNIAKESNVFIVYGTSSGQIAQNMSDNDRNGLFTSIIKNHLRRGEDIQLMFNAIGRKLRQLGQIPEMLMSFTEGFEW